LKKYKPNQISLENHVKQKILFTCKIIRLPAPIRAITRPYLAPMYPTDLKRNIEFGVTFQQHYTIEENFNTSQKDCRPEIGSWDEHCPAYRRMSPPFPENRPVFSRPTTKT